MSLSRCIIITLLSTQLFSQNNHVYVELLGPGLMASINYERNIDNNIFVRHSSITHITTKCFLYH